MQWKTLLLITALLSLATVAQEQNEQTGETEETEESAAQTQPTAEKPPGNSEKNADDYRPTEEISEDLSVSYPVDI